MDSLDCPLSIELGNDFFDRGVLDKEISHGIARRQSAYEGRRRYKCWIKAQVHPLVFLFNNPDVALVDLYVAL